MATGVISFGLDSQGNVIAVPVGEMDLETTSSDNIVDALNAVVVFDVPQGYMTATLDLRGTGTHTMVFEGTVDGTNWVGLSALSGQNALVTSVTAATATLNIYRLTIMGLRSFRIRTSAWTSGSSTVFCRVGPEDPPGIATSLPVDTELSAAATMSDALTNPSAGGVAAYQAVFNGTTWERYRGSENRSILASGARTSTPAGIDVITYNARSMVVFVNVTVGNATGLHFGIDIKDTISGAYHEILTTAALIGTAAGLWVFVVSPSLDTAAMAGNRQSVKFPLPRTVRLRPIHPGAGSITYSVSVDLID